MPYGVLIRRYMIKHCWCIEARRMAVLLNKFSSWTISLKFSTYRFYIQQTSAQAPKAYLECLMGSPLTQEFQTSLQISQALEFETICQGKPIQHQSTTWENKILISLPIKESIISCMRRKLNVGVIRLSGLQRSFCCNIWFPIFGPWQLLYQHFNPIYFIRWYHVH